MLLRPVEAEHGDEAAFGGGEPVGFFVFARVFVLQVEVDGAVGVLANLLRSLSV